MAHDTEVILSEMKSTQKYMKERFDKLEHRLQGVSGARIDLVEEKMEKLSRQTWTIAGAMAAFVAYLKHSP